MYVHCSIHFSHWIPPPPKYDELLRVISRNFFSARGSGLDGVCLVASRVASAQIELSSRAERRAQASVCVCVYVPNSPNINMTAERSSARSHVHANVV